MKKGVNGREVMQHRKGMVPRLRLPFSIHSLLTKMYSSPESQFFRVILSKSQLSDPVASSALILVTDPTSGNSTGMFTFIARVNRIPFLLASVI